MDNSINQNTDTERIETAKNRVFYTDGLGLGRNNPISLHTDITSVYRVTGMNQIADIINCGYIRPQKGRVKGGHENEVFWSIGGEKTFYWDKRPVLEAPANKVENGQIGSLSIDDLSAIWIFDEEQDCYINKIDYIKSTRDIIKTSHNKISGEQLKELLIKISERESLESKDQKNKKTL